MYSINFNENQSQTDIKFSIREGTSFNDFMAS
jgi:hypothetical protein